jgi:L-threonylcarbamoyladenylate synthase
VIISQITDSLPRISAVTAHGGVVAFRTDTFYGLGGDPFNRDAVQKIKKLKGREEHKPILIIISDREAVARLVAVPTPTFDLLAKTFWPGPLTLIGRAESDVPNELTAGTGTIGVRLPDNDDVRELIRACGGALTATSANPANRQPARTAQEVFDYFGDDVDLIVDGGEVTADRPSTVVHVCEAEPRLVREGAIAWEYIQAALGRSDDKS